MPIFDSYIVVDWSAAQSPCSGPDSVWIYALDRDERGVAPFCVANPSTRLQALGILIDVLSDFVARGRMTLVGFDFAFGYPSGFAGRLRPAEPTWLGVWKQLAARIHDHDDNANNRFQVAAALNAELSGADYPFWGCPAPKAGLHLSARKPTPPAAPALDEFRLAERAAHPAQSVWKLYYPGCVGGQTLLGIPYVHRLRHHPLFAETSRVWPFETGLRKLERSANDDPTVIFAEVYPSFLEKSAASAGGDEPKDLHQIRCLAHHFARLDTDNELAALFAGPPGLDPRQRRMIETEEGWILGVVGANGRRATPQPGRYTDVRDPRRIDEQAVATIRREVDLRSFSPPLAEVAVRLIQACGDPGVAGFIHASEAAVETACRALRAGAPILVDTPMTAAGINRERLPGDNAVVCALGEPGGAEAAPRRAMTAAATGVDLSGDWLEGSVVAIGDAPTALFRLLELIDSGAGVPAAILAFPVGFVGATEAKEALIAHPLGLHHITVRGRRGGSAMAAAAINALANARR